MKACFLAMLSFLAASSSAAQLPYTEKQVIDYAKSVDVKTLDPSLSSQRLEDWLQSGPPHAQTLIWLLEETCQNKPGNNNEDYPLCVQIRVKRDAQWGEFLVQLGTWHKGIGGSPQLYWGIGILEGPDWGEGTGYAERLSDLPILLDQPNRFIIEGVRKLYEEIVAHHPIGIPAGADKVTIWPLLSKRLIGQLQAAQACEEDYSSQHQTTDTTSKPTWLKAGIFSGDGKRALPTHSRTLPNGPRKDGPFLVYVDLAYFPDQMHVPDQMWTVAAKVISENGHFVVDDVRLFDGASADGPSHLLSDSFAGCDGSHWTGRYNALVNSLP